MPHEATHASFFSGVGGLDLGLERAGWRTVSFSEIDPYASAVLAERWPDVPNLGDIQDIAEDGVWQRAADLVQGDWRSESSAAGIRAEQFPAWRDATLWSGGFPCQDLSVAGKRAGFAGERSSLAFAFLDLVERHRPPAILLENVPGLLSSHRGRDFGTLLDRLAELGYGWAYRILDARHFGVPQRRRRVFIVALHAERGFGADSAAAVLSVGARCGRHPATGHEARTGVAAATPGSPDIAGTVTGPSPNRGWPGNFEADWAYTATAKFGEFIGGSTVGNLSARDYKSPNHLLSPSPDPGGVRAPDGLARGVDSGGVVGALNATKAAGGWRAGPDEAAAGHIVVGQVDQLRGAVGRGREVNDLLPLGLDSHRYRCCGNGVVSNVAEWIGVRLLAAIERAA